MSGEDRTGMSLPASFVILTMGDRPDELKRAIESIQRQEGIAAEIIVISNGAGEVAVPDDCRLYVSRENLGYPEGATSAQPTVQAT